MLVDLNHFPVHWLWGRQATVLIVVAQLTTTTSATLTFVLGPCCPVSLVNTLHSEDIIMSS